MAAGSAEKAWSSSRTVRRLKRVAGRMVTLGRDAAPDQPSRATSVPGALPSDGDAAGRESTRRPDNDQ
jgi:hypothetical protein